MSPDRKYCIILHERLFPEPAEYVIKRVIALEGDEVEPSSDAASSSVVTLNRGAAWVEGDNAQNSIDSNSYGPICLGLVVGKASHVIWPPGYQLLEMTYFTKSGTDHAVVILLLMQSFILQYSSASKPII